MFFIDSKPNEFIEYVKIEKDDAHPLFNAIGIQNRIVVRELTISTDAILDSEFARIKLIMDEIVSIKEVKLGQDMVSSER